MIWLISVRRVYQETIKQMIQFFLNIFLVFFNIYENVRQEGIQLVHPSADQSDFLLNTQYTQYKWISNASHICRITIQLFDEMPRPEIPIF